MLEINNDVICVPIEGSDGQYEVGTDGSVLSYSRSKQGRRLKPFEDKDGYLMVNLRSVGLGVRKVHRLVAEAFLDNPEHKETVNHLDGDKGNNDVSNLAWATRSENMRHAYDRLNISPKKISDEDALSIHFDKDHTNRELAEKYGVSESHVSRIKRGFRSGKSNRRQFVC